MEYKRMNLHTNKKLFSDTIRAASEHLKINEEFVEKDYWITLLLKKLSKSKYSKDTVFKGGTSLSKCYGIINRFSEDVDIAIINDDDKSGNQVKTIIRETGKAMTTELTEINIEGVTSKGSRFRKTVHEYESTDPKNKNNKIIVEINSFANPFPHLLHSINTMVHDFLNQTGNTKIIEQYNLQPFQINVLDKKQTLLEKLASLIRFSLDENPAESIKNKIRHFYDIYYLISDTDCISFSKTEEFKTKFNELLIHDKEIFDEPVGWKNKSIYDSPLLHNFDSIWEQLKSTYRTELFALAFSAIPDEEEIAKSFKEIVSIIR
jgi:predicted nucleotidyltransferase component of viral defense system